jgi:hypothetical protein
LAVFQGTVHTINFLFKSDGSPIDVTGWEFSAKLKANRASTTALVTLTSAGGGFVIADATAGRVSMVLSAVNTALLPAGRIVFDVLRTDGTNSPVYLAGGSFQVKTSVTTYTVPDDEDDVVLPGDGGDPPPIVIDLTPEPFVFNDLTGAVKSTVYESNVIFVDGITGGEVVDLTITGGEYATAGADAVFGAWASTATTVRDSDIVKVRTTSSATELTAVDVVLTIGGVSDTWTVTTEEDADPAVVIPDAFTFVDVTNITAGAVTESNAITVTGTTVGAPVAMTITGGEYQVNSGTWASAARTVVAGDSIKVRGTAIPAEDPDFASVSFLSGFEGSHAATTVTDESSNAHTMTMGGTAAQIRTSKLKFGTSSYYNGALTQDGRVTTPDHATFEFGAGAFTVEGWFAFTATTTSCDLLSKRNDTGNQRSWALIYSSTADQLLFSISVDGTATTSVVVETGTWVPVLNQWYHLACDFDGTTYRLYRDGVVIGTGVVLVTAFDGTSVFAVGNRGGNNSDFPGYIDEVRITKGVARYAGAYTPLISAFARDGATGIVDVVLDIGGVTDTFRITTQATAPGVEATPDAFSFTDQSNLSLSTTYDSNVITVAGINTAAPLSVTGGLYSKNTGPWVSTATTVVAGDTVRLRGTSSATNATDVPVTLNIGGVTDTFTLRTVDIGTSRKIILDTDCAGDVDDMMTVGIASKLKNDGVLDLVLVNVSSTVDSSAPCVRATLDHYGGEAVTVSAYQGATGSYTMRFSDSVRDRFGVVGQTRTAYTDDLTGLRTALAAATDATIEIIAIGGLVSLSRLLDSPADGISALTGSQLIAAKVIKLTCQAGENPGPAGSAEFNMLRSPTHSANVANNWPTPIVWNGTEIGETVMAGPAQGLSAYDDPIRHGFDVYTSTLTDGKRFSFDPLCFHQAIYGNNTNYTWGIQNGTNSVNSSTAINTFTATAGNDSYTVKAASDSALGAQLDAIVDSLTGNISRVNRVAKSNGFVTTVVDPIYTTPWSITSAGVTITGGQSDPFGGTTAFLFTETATTNSHNFFSQNFWTVSGSNYVAEVYVKNGTRRYVQLGTGSGMFGVNGFANFDLQLGVVGTKGSAVGSSWITPVPDQAGWFRIGMALTASATGEGDLTIRPTNSASAARNNSFLGNVSNNFYACAVLRGHGNHRLRLDNGGRTRPRSRAGRVRLARGA